LVRPAWSSSISSNPLEIVLPCGSKKVLEGIMKKFFVAIMLSLLAVSFVAATDLTISGSIGQNVSVDFTDGLIAINVLGDGTGTLNGSASGFDNAAALKVISNRKKWTITFHSGNAGTLKSESLTPIPYKLHVTPVDADFATATFTNPLSAGVSLATDKTFQATADGRTKKTGGTLNVSVSVDAIGDDVFLWDAQSTYSDTVTITIAADL
jgi:hypothetical protein